VFLITPNPWRSESILPLVCRKEVRDFLVLIFLAFNSILKDIDDASPSPEEGCPPSLPDPVHQSELTSAWTNIASEQPA
jgi:hypothetical protein